MKMIYRANSATKLASQQSIKAYVDATITAQDLDFQGDSGGALSIDLDSETLTLLVEQDLQVQVQVIHNTCN